MTDEMKEQPEGGFIISKIHQLSQRIFARILKDYNLEKFNPAQGRIMFVLWREDGLPIHKLVERTQFSKSTLTFHLDNLEKTGLIKRTLNPHDRREILINLTVKNQKLQDEYIAISNEMTKIYYNDFKDNEIEEFESYLDRILINLTEYDK
ncbi:MAG: MarR family winged helix-turn-helix transcriptional regulator [Promethearchaeota archaeon]|jgi:DNA-binding MarR family transcriptional regulator